MSTLCNINFKYGNRTESSQKSQADIKVLTEGISVKTTLTIVSTNKTWNNIRNCYCNHPANITGFPNLILLWSVSCVRGFSNADVCDCMPRFTLQAVLATYSLNDSMPSSFPCPANWCKAPDVAMLNTKWGAHLFYATSKLKYITLRLYIN